MSKDREAVHKYLCTTNRPYSANDIMLNLHKEFGKTAIQKALDELVGEGKVLEKTYGKQKVYCIKQEIVSNSQVSDELKDTDQELLQAAEKLSCLENEVKQAQAQLNELLSTPTTEEGRAEQCNLIKKNEALLKKVAELSQCTIKTPEIDRNKIKQEHSKMVKEYNKRKRICTEIINAILEGYPKSKKVLIEEIGIETDEIVNMPKIS